MKPFRLTIAFAILAASVVLCLWGGGWITWQAADESLRRSLLIIGTIGVALTLVYGLLSATPKKTPESKDGSSRPGPQF